MKLAALLTAAAVLALAGSAAALPVPPLPNPGEIQILDLIYENVYSIESCLAASLSGSVGLRTIEEPPYVALDAPELNPPSPDCLTLPG